MFGELKSWFQQLVAEKQIEVDESVFIAEQAKFLLTQAALVEAPPVQDKDKYSLGSGGQRLRASSAPFGYMNPLTFFALVQGAAHEHGEGVFYTLSGSPTKWILTSLVPEGTMILGPNLMPGLAGIVRKQLLKEAANA